MNHIFVIKSNFHNNMAKTAIQMIPTPSYTNVFETAIYKPFNHQKHVIPVNSYINIELYAYLNTIKSSGCVHLEENTSTLGYEIYYKSHPEPQTTANKIAYFGPFFVVVFLDPEKKVDCIREIYMA